MDGLVAKGIFRQDLFFRLNVLVVHLPPLRERTSDIPLLAEHFLNIYRARYKQPEKFLHSATLNWMRHYPWPGNVRELENLIHREFLLAEGPEISSYLRPAATTQDAATSRLLPSALTLVKCST